MRDVKRFFVSCVLVLLFSALWLVACGDDAGDVVPDGDADAADGDSSDGDVADGDGSDGDLDTPADGDLDVEMADRVEDDAEGGDTDEDAALDRWGFPPDQPLLQPGFLNIAHRGGGKLAPEESMQAFQNAVAVGADLLEMDLHATSDGVIVLHHDATVDRITDGTGKIKEMTYDQLMALDAGYQFTADGGASYPFRGTGVRIARFRDVLEAFPTLIFSAEIKQSDPPIIDPVLQILAETGMEDRVILVSFNDSVVEEIRQKNPRIVTGAGTGEMVVFSTLTADGLDDYEPPCPMFQLPGIDAAQLALAHQLGVKVQIWTINDAAEMRHYIELGVDGVMTDDPALLESVREELDAEAETSDN